MGTSLRLILLMIGIIILAIVVWDVLRNQTRKMRSGKLNYRINDLEPELDLFESKRESEPEPELEIEYESILVDEAIDIKIDTQITEPETIVEADFFAINVLAREAIGFKGSSLVKEFTSGGLEFGKWNIFHKLYNTHILFSVASSKEPGIFKKNLSSHDHFPGIVLFFVISKCPNPQLALDEIVKLAKKIAFKLNGELLDKNNKPLTLQTLSLYKNNLSKLKQANL